MKKVFGLMLVAALATGVAFAGGDKKKGGCCSKGDKKECSKGDKKGGCCSKDKSASMDKKHGGAEEKEAKPAEANK